MQLRYGRFLTVHHVLGLYIQRVTALGHLGKRYHVARSVVNPFAVVSQSVQVMVERLLQIVKGG